MYYQPLPLVNGEPPKIKREILPDGMYEATIDMVQQKYNDQFGPYLMLGWKINPPHALEGKMIFESFYLNHPDTDKRYNSQVYFEMLLDQVLGTVPRTTFDTLSLKGKQATLTISNFFNKRSGEKQDKIAGRKGVGLAPAAKAAPDFNKVLNDELPYSH